MIIVSSAGWAFLSLARPPWEIWDNARLPRASWIWGKKESAFTYFIPLKENSDFPSVWWTDSYGGRKWGKRWLSCVSRDAIVLCRSVLIGTGRWCLLPTCAQPPQHNVLDNNFARKSMPLSKALFSLQLQLMRPLLRILASLLHSYNQVRDTKSGQILPCFCVYWKYNEWQWILATTYFLQIEPLMSIPIETVNNSDADFKKDNLFRHYHLCKSVVQSNFVPKRVMAFVNPSPCIELKILSILNLIIIN